MNTNTNTQQARTFELPCLDSRKSFYGKAHVTEYPNGEKILRSYNTDVAKITPDGDLVRLWSGSSMTTSRHIRSFCKFYGVSECGRA